MHNTKLERHLTEPDAFPYMVSIFIYIYWWQDIDLGLMKFLLKSLIKEKEAWPFPLPKGRRKR